MNALERVPTADLISPDFTAFTRQLVARDGALDIYLNRSAGPVAISGGEFGPQTIQTLAMGADLEQFLQSSMAALNSKIGLKIRFVDRPEVADVRFYLDSTIDLGDGGLTLGIALMNPRPGGGHWEVILNTPQLQDNPFYLNYAANHELGHVMGLEHPFDSSDGDVYLSGNPSRSAYPEQTVMAYRDPAGVNWPQTYSPSDVDSLQAIWGVPTTAPAPLDSSSKPNLLIGTNGVDRITGGPGNDELEGLAGADQMRGGLGSNVYASPADGARDWVVITPDGSRRPSQSAKTVDVITELGDEDRIAILGARTRQLGFARVALDSPTYGTLEGIGIYERGRLEAIYTGGLFNRYELSQLTFGLPTDTLA